MEPRYYYVRGSHREPVACIAFVLEGERLIFGMSVHNPVDLFNRNLARNIALGRLLKKPHSLLFQKPFLANIKKICDTVIETLGWEAIAAARDGGERRFCEANRLLAKYLAAKEQAALIAPAEKTEAAVA